MAKDIWLISTNGLTTDCQLVEQDLLQLVRSILRVRVVTWVSAQREESERYHRRTTGVAVASS